MNEKQKSQIERIEDTQEALRETIDEAKRLAEEADKLLQSHKSELDKDKKSS